MNDVRPLTRISNEYLGIVTKREPITNGDQKTLQDLRMQLRGIFTEAARPSYDENLIQFPTLGFTAFRRGNWFDSQWTVVHTATGETSHNMIVDRLNARESAAIAATKAYLNILKHTAKEPEIMDADGAREFINSFENPEAGITGEGAEKLSAAFLACATVRADNTVLFDYGDENDDKYTAHRVDRNCPVLGRQWGITEGRHDGHGGVQRISPSIGPQDIGGLAKAVAGLHLNDIC